MSIEHYIAAIETLSQRGENPTLEAIRKQAGGGSFSTITAARKLWQSRKVTIAPVAAGELPASLTTFAGEIWRQACELADSRVAAERASLAAARQDLEQGQTELCETADRLAAETERLTSECKALRAECDVLRAKLDMVTTERDASHALLRERLSALLPKEKPAKSPREAITGADAQAGLSPAGAAQTSDIDMPATMHA